MIIISVHPVQKCSIKIYIIQHFFRLLEILNAESDELLFIPENHHRQDSLCDSVQFILYVTDLWLK